MVPPKLTAEQKAQAKLAFVNCGEPIPSIAHKLGVSKRTIERICLSENWRELRLAAVSVSPAVLRYQNSISPEKLELVVTTKLADIDDHELLAAAIMSVSALFTPGAKVDHRSLASCALALIKLLEFKHKLLPRNARDIAERLVELDITPAELVEELRAIEWQRQKSA